MGYMLVVPELVILWAGRQYFAAKAYASKHQGTFPAFPCSLLYLHFFTERGWTRTHAHFLIMGGFALHDADKSFLRVLDESTLEELYVKEEIVWPSITEPEIQDRSKADLFSKGIVLLQTAWFIIECLSRFATKLAVTELEVVTLAFAALNGITYWLWWHKPSDVRCPVPVYLKPGAESKVQRVQDARAQRDPEHTTTISSSDDIPTQPASGRLSFTRRRSKHGLIIAVLQTVVWVPIRTVFGHLNDIVGRDELPEGDLSRVPTYFSSYAEEDVLGLEPSSWTMVGVIALFGAIHFIPWTSAFPSSTERLLWKVSVVTITSGPLLVIALMLGMSAWKFDLKFRKFVDISVIYLMFSIFAIYLGSRIVLLVLPLILLRNLPPTALLELKWSKFFPHI